MMASLSISQTFSRILDPLDGRYNYINDMQIHDGSIYMSSYHCYIGIAPKLGCNQQSKWSLAGDLEKSVLIDSLFSQGRNNVVLLDNNIGFSGTWVQKEYTFENPITILEFDQNLDIVSKQLTHSIEGEHYFNDGLVHIEGYNYLYGNIKDQGATVFEKTQVFKEQVNKNGFEDMRFVRAAGPPGFNTCHDLQATQDGNLIYINKFGDWIGAGGESGVQIMITDQDGLKLDSVEFKGESRNLRLLPSNEGPIYCMTDDHPEPPNNLPSHGRINKYSADLDTLLWSLELPFNNFINGRRYRLRDFLQASNGDIMVCGTVFDDGDDGPIENGLDHVFNGFVVRVSQEGEMKWLRIYKIPIVHELLPTDEFGKYRTSSLQKIEELSDGRFVLGGIAEHNTIQINVLYPAGETVSHVWLMTIGEDGCIEGEECQEVIILDQEIAYTFEGSLVSPSNQWNEVSYDFQGTAFNRRYTFATDSTFTNGNWYYELLRSWDETGNNWENTGEYFRKSGSKIYQIVEGEDYTLYDFSLTEGDTFTIAETSNIPERKLIVSQIDSVSLIDNSKRKRLYLRCEDDPDASLYGERIWIEGVGDMQGLLSVDESCTLDQNGKLLCFYEDDQALYQDPIEGKCWITTSTKELIDYGIEIFPNPVKNRIVISGLNGAAGYKLYTSNGATILSGQTNGEIDVNSLSSALYLLELSIEGKSITTRVIKD